MKTWWMGIQHKRFKLVLALGLATMTAAAVLGVLHFFPNIQPTFLYIFLVLGLLLVVLATLGTTMVTNRQLQSSLKELSVLYNISQALTSSIDPEELCNRLGEVILKNVGVDDFAILLFNEELDCLEVKAARGFRKNDQVRQLTFELGEGISGRVAQQKEEIYIRDTSSDPDYLYYKGIKVENGSFLSLPILSKDALLGVINFSRGRCYAFSNEERHMLSVVVGQIAIALENARLYAKTRELSMVDELTQVFNRRYFQKILNMEFKRAQRFDRPISLLMIDIDYFKKINDSFGHMEGDKILAQLAMLLSENLREVDTVARFGGEEFAIILPNTENQNALKVAAKLNHLVDGVRLPLSKGKQAWLTVSIGVASYLEDDESMDDLINHADIALYQAKAQGRNQVVAYGEDEKIERTALTVVGNS